jgi:2-hydroxychromene-2-carboxylate isomerase
LIEKAGAEVTWRPFLVGGVFNAVNQSVYAARENPNDPKFRLTFHWLLEWAELAGVPMNFPSAHHPLKSVPAMRACCALEDAQDALVTFTEAAFHAYFADQRNLDDPHVLGAIADECGLDGAALMAKITEQPVKDLLFANTQEAIDRGAFGSPTIIINETKLYFGNDQLPLVARTLGL